MTETEYVPGSVKSFSCPNCGGTINIRAVGITVTAACGSCGSTVDVADPQLRILQKASEAARSDLLLPLGSRGALFDDEWEVIGYMERATEPGDYEWSEYLLFNPWQGFRFLVEDNGHWNFVKMLRRNFEFKLFKNIDFDGRSYQLYNRGYAKVVYALGEFYWRVKVGETAAIRDYVAPPFMLSREKSNQDVIWSHATYVAPERVRAAFGVSKPWIMPVGVAPNQPSPATTSIGSYIRIGSVAFVCLLATQIVANGLAKKQVLIDGKAEATAAQKDTPTVTPEFEILGDTGNVEIRVGAPVDNDWIEVDAELVNQSTEERDETVADVEYYHGRDSDGDWAEGSQVVSDVLSAVPGGKYRLFLTVDAGAFSEKQQSQPIDGNAGKPVVYRVTVTRDIAIWSNFWVAALMLLFWIPVVKMHGWIFEQRRWSQSFISMGVDPDE
jgi:hypothetical protein